ncbi:MAG: hypothetical protein FIB07_17740 [Candidatus Methanoperedens sp.]|nr:hypothetical protein [Candidatus Methanoperedens sp.]
MIIVDTNVLLAFLLTNGITRRIIAENPDVFVSPEHCFGELWEHRDRWNRNKLSDDELLEVVSDVKRLFVIAVPTEVCNPYIPEAEKLKDDKDDAPIIALALLWIMKESGPTIQNTSDRRYLESVSGIVHKRCHRLISLRG